MAFWKKSDDPWDRKPEKRSAPVYTGPEAESSNEPGLLD